MFEPGLTVASTSRKMNKTSSFMEFTVSASTNQSTTVSRLEARRAELAAVLERMRANPRVATITIAVSHDACPACQAVQGNYAKDHPALELPVAGCSHAIIGTCAYYMPVLNIIYP